MQSLVFLYNDRDHPTVENVCIALEGRLVGSGVKIWLAKRDLGAFGGDIFDQIEGAIEESSGVIFFLGEQGLGRFQKHIELGAVCTERWQRGAGFGQLLVHLAPKLDVPRPLLRWPSVNHDGAVRGEDNLAEEIFRRLGLAPASVVSRS